MSSNPEREQYLKQEASDIEKYLTTVYKYGYQKIVPKEFLEIEEGRYAQIMKELKELNKKN